MFYERASLNKDYTMPDSSKTISTGTYHTKATKSVSENYFYESRRHLLKHL